MASGHADYAPDITFPLTPQQGGTGRTTLTLNGVILGNAALPVNVTAAGTANQILQVPSAGGAPVFQNLNISGPTGILPIANGGTGTATPGLVAGTGISLSGAWPDTTITNTSAYATLADPLPVAHGGTGTATPGLVAGANVTITGAWPDQTIALNPSLAAPLTLTINVATDFGLKIVEAASQSTNPFQIANSTGTVLFDVTPGGNVDFAGVLTSSGAIRLNTGGAANGITLNTTGGAAIILNAGVQINFTNTIPFTINNTAAVNAAYTRAAVQGVAKWEWGMGAGTAGDSFQIRSETANATVFEITNAGAVFCGPTSGSAVGIQTTGNTWSVTADGDVVMTPATATTTHFKLQLPAAQSVLVWEILDSGAVQLLGIGKNGNTTITVDDPGAIPLALKLAASPTANAFEVLTSLAAVLTAIGSDGNITWPGVLTSAGVVTINAGGTNQGVTFNVTGTGQITFNGACNMGTSNLSQGAVNVLVDLSGSGTESQMQLQAKSDEFSGSGFILGKNQSTAAISGYHGPDWSHVINIRNAPLVLGANNVGVVWITGTSVGIGTHTPGSHLAVVGLPVYANNAAAITGGLAAGDFYRDGGDPDHVCVVH